VLSDRPKYVLLIGCAPWQSLLSTMPWWNLGHASYI